MKISPYTSYLELQPNALLVRQIFYYLQKVGVTVPAALRPCRPMPSLLSFLRQEMEAVATLGFSVIAAVCWCS
jgi:hypothetical protein